MRTVLLYLSAVILGGAGAWLVARWGKRLSLIDMANDRSSHEGVIPKGDPQITQICADYKK